MDGEWQRDEWWMNEKWIERWNNGGWLDRCMDDKQIGEGWLQNGCQVDGQWIGVNA